MPERGLGLCRLREQFLWQRCLPGPFLMTTLAWMPCCAVRSVCSLLRHMKAEHVLCSQQNAAMMHSMAFSARLNVMQAAVKRLTDIDSVLTTLQACMILIYLRRLSTLASAIPYFNLFIGAS
jgi:hypothetical protein